jgi:hypothetical protein
MPPEDTKPLCPSAQPDMEGARVFGVIAGTPEAPRVAYLTKGTTVDPATYTGLEGVGPTHLFRFAARCEEARCVHYGGGRCALADRIAKKLDPVVDSLPPCLIRPECRWYAEQGGDACLRCPQVVTMIPKADDSLNWVALPNSGREDAEERSLPKRPAHSDVPWHGRSHG